MNTTSASRADPRAVLVWDAPLRVFHWLLALCFAGAWLTADSESWRLVHVTLGYTMVGLLAFRMLWGFVGPRHARFADFVRGPGAVLRYLSSLRHGRPEHHAGHTPAGGLAVVALLMLAMLVTATGIANYQEWGGNGMEEVHEALAIVMLVLVAVHVAAVLLGSALQRENLVLAMLTGRKKARPSESIRRPWRGVAALVLAAVAGFWWTQWQDAPAAGDTHARAVHEDDD